MKRSYIVIPEGTAVVKVEASSPHFAASKALHGKGARVTMTAATVAAESAATAVAEESPTVIAGQLCWGEDGLTIERAAPLG
jgi:hypothetical protein